jgi:hypothetical protein
MRGTYSTQYTRTHCGDIQKKAGLSPSSLVATRTNLTRLNSNERERQKERERRWKIEKKDTKESGARKE